MRVLILALLLASPAAAFEAVTTRDAFLAAVEGKRLTGDGISLRVAPDGTLGGRGFGLRVTGTWDWRGPYFCRTLDTVLRDFPLNCQTVAIQGDVVRFQADEGQGDVADLRIR